MNRNKNNFCSLSPESYIIWELSDLQHLSKSRSNEIAGIHDQRYNIFSINWIGRDLSTAINLSLYINNCRAALPIIILPNGRTITIIHLCTITRHKSREKSLYDPSFSRPVTYFLMNRQIFVYTELGTDIQTYFYNPLHKDIFELQYIIFQNINVHYNIFFTLTWYSFIIDFQKKKM